MLWTTGPWIIMSLNVRKCITIVNLSTGYLPTYHTCPKIWHSPLYYLLIFLKYCSMYGKQCRTWSDAAYAVSDLGLHCSQRPICPNIKDYYGIWHACPVKNQISSCSCTVWSVFNDHINFASLVIQNAPSEYSDQTALMQIFAGHTCAKLCFLDSVAQMFFLFCQKHCSIHQKYIAQFLLMSISIPQFFFCFVF